MLGIFGALFATWLALDPAPFSGVWGLRWLCAFGLAVLLGGILDARRHLGLGSVVLFGLALVTAAVAVERALGPVTIDNGGAGLVCGNPLDAVDPLRYKTLSASGPCPIEGRRRLRQATALSGVTVAFAGAGLVAIGGRDRPPHSRWMGGPR